MIVNYCLCGLNRFKIVYRLKNRLKYFPTNPLLHISITRVARAGVAKIIALVPAPLVAAVPATHAATRVWHVAALPLRVAALAAEAEVGARLVGVGIVAVRATPIRLCRFFIYFLFGYSITYINSIEELLNLDINIIFFIKKIVNKSMSAACRCWRCCSAGNANSAL